MFDKNSHSIAELVAEIQKLGISASLNLTNFFLMADLKLYLLSGNLTKKFDEQQMRKIAEYAPMWALIWSGGSALAKLLLEKPTIIKDKHIIDFGAGSGIIGLLALKLGAKKVYFCDADKKARAAIKANILVNNLAKKNFTISANLDSLKKHIKKQQAPVDFLFAADLLYQNSNKNLLKDFNEIAQNLVLAESHSLLDASTQAEFSLKKLEDMHIKMQPDLDSVHRLVNIWSNNVFI